MVRASIPHKGRSDPLGSKRPQQGNHYTIHGRPLSWYVTKIKFLKNKNLVNGEGFGWVQNNGSPKASLLKGPNTQSVKQRIGLLKPLSRDPGHSWGGLGEEGPGNTGALFHQNKVFWGRLCCIWILRGKSISDASDPNNKPETHASMTTGAEGSGSCAQFFRISTCPGSRSAAGMCSVCLSQLKHRLGARPKVEP